MRIPRLFVDHAIDVNASVQLTGPQLHYLKNVIRCRPGQQILLFNGRGGEYMGTIDGISRNEACISITEFEQDDRESPLKTRLGLGISKRDGMEEALRKATELGVTEITPISCEFSTVSGKALAKRYEHWREIVRHACQQCERNRLPDVRHPMSLIHWITGVDSDLKYFAHPGAKGNFDRLPLAPASVCVLTGPEGGLSTSEVQMAEDSGFLAINLGPRILRAETAPLVMLALIQSRWGDLQAREGATSRSNN